MKSTSPYRRLDASAVWKRSVGDRPWEDVVPVPPGCRPIEPGARIASAGSCFAQRIAERLPELGLDYFVTERGPQFLDEADRGRFGYGVYSARYGNIYTAAQLLQLAQRAFGSFAPVEACWRKGDVIVDPFRPGICGSGFVSERECLADRDRHLECVRELLSDTDVFVFTLGLTEAWRCRADGAVLPVCPGAGHGGRFDPEHYEFVNFGFRDVAAHIQGFLDLVRSANPGLRLVLTVSPVPLVATFSAQHVLSATTYSKSVLRAAAGEIAARDDLVDYFPSYEIVTQGDGSWAFAPDRREVTTDAVAHVIECFRRQFVAADAPRRAGPDPRTELQPARPRPLCDEDQILAAMAERNEP